MNVPSLEFRIPQPSAMETPMDLDQVDRWWRAANYLSVGQIYPGQPRAAPRPRVPRRGLDHHALRHDVLNRLDRFDLALAAVERVERMSDRRQMLQWSWSP